MAFKRNEKRDGDDELSIPLLTSLHSASAVENESLDEFTGSDMSLIDANDVPAESSSPEQTDKKSNENEIENSDKSLKVEIKKVSDLESNDSDLLSLNESRSSNDEYEIETREHEEFDVEEDIDTIVSEYKEQLKISTSGSKMKRYPTKETARTAFLLILANIFLIFFLFFVSFRFKGGSDSISEATSILKVVILMVNIFIILVVLYNLLKLPTVFSFSPSSRNGLKLPGSPLISIVALSLNILLFSEISIQVFWTLIPVYILGK